MSNPKSETTNPYSLLYPAGSENTQHTPYFLKNTPEDMGVEIIVKELAYDRQYETGVRNLLLELNTSIAVIEYRQEILADLLENPTLADGLKDGLASISKLQRYSQPITHKKEESIRQVLDRLMELNLYIECVQQLQKLLSSEEKNIHSAGLRGLLTFLNTLESDKTFQSLRNQVPDLIKKLSATPSITIGINLDVELRPIEAILLSVNNKPFREGSLFDRLMGRAESGKPEEGIGPMHSVPFEQVSSLIGQVVQTGTRSDPLLVPLFRDVYQVLKTVFQPISNTLQRYSDFHTGLLLFLEKEIAFYLGAAQMLRRLKSHSLPICRPQAIPPEKRALRLTGMYNLLLAFHLIARGETSAIVLNDAQFGENGRIFILTGPNQGGKTVFTQGIGITHLLFQAGLYLPAQEATLSPIDGLFTHFASEETFDANHGRLSEESMRLNEIFQHLTPHSLVLLNETLSSTSAADSLYLSRDILRALRAYQTRAIFATHLHELAEELDQFNAEGQSDSKVESLVAGVDLTDEELLEAQDKFVPRTFQIKQGPPRGLSFARGIAQKNGISYEQLIAIKDGSR